MNSGLRLTELHKSFGGLPAVRGINLDIDAGEFFSLLGPSGCGKTTTLRMIAGFEQPDRGAITLDDVDLVAMPPHRRPVNTVFQNYALFPFLDVRRNVAFGLKYLKLGKAETARRVDEALALVRMSSFASRRPAQLSGGQQQRVALARALVLRPSVLLLDEPLGALDAKLRKELQGELRAVQREVGITFVYVTHDQEEALTMSDRIAVLADGLIEQVGTPEQVYSEPASAYVAGFLGSANVVDVEVVAVEETATCRLGPHVLQAVPTAEAPEGAGKLVIRPERVTLGPTGAEPRHGAAALNGLVDRVVYTGPTTQVLVRLADGQTLLAAVPNQAGPASVKYAAGDPVTAFVAPDAARLLAP
ncbi:ABC transporter ATP-binding protein [Cryptosporangium aurantiacum]|uniref:Spermidine/putrescine import ATP-binding protein PotA n=1 Tax=Cryptosporangium aurantiacum TaxID=134849 RepID=A0A1M7M9R1_9ACTN|nr:ABC transporter ATP-binding protein [Cryptosporangium aurantiacum]SHM87520.1 spermidine/putrescine transport system ATP-binding protein [Cryptosporangium aurantiacum]